jgi:hypothetical protein
MTAVTCRMLLVCSTCLLWISPSSADAGLPWFSQCPQKGTDAWWDQQAASPPGTRQIYHKGKLWPPFPRPVGEPQKFSHKYHSSHYWPYPYVCDDRAYILGLVQQQTMQGWIEATTLYDCHFSEEQQLNHSGQMQLRWILENVPSEHRHAYVQTSGTAAASQARLSTVRQTAQEMVGPEGVPPIELRIATMNSRPAVEIDRIRRAEMQSVIQPRITLPVRIMGGGRGGGGGAGGGAGGANSGASR